MATNVSRLGLHGGPRPPQARNYQVNGEVPIEDVLVSTNVMPRTNEGRIRRGLNIYFEIYDPGTTGNWVTPWTATEQQAFIDSLDTTSVASAGWTNKIQTVLPTASVIRSSDVIVTLEINDTHLPNLNDYDIDAGDDDPEWIAPDFPSSLFTLASVSQIGHSFGIERIQLALGGGVSPSISEVAFANGGASGTTLTITIGNDGDIQYRDKWKSFLTTADKQAIFDGITSDKSEPSGWTNLVAAGFDVDTGVVRTSDYVVTLTFSDTTVTNLSNYDISETEVLTVVVPGSALVDSNRNEEATTTFSILYAPDAIGSIFASPIFGGLD